MHRHHYLTVLEDQTSCQTTCIDKNLKNSDRDERAEGPYLIQTLGILEIGYTQ